MSYVTLGSSTAASKVKGSSTTTVDLKQKPSGGGAGLLVDVDDREPLVDTRFYAEDGSVIPQPTAASSTPVALILAAVAAAFLLLK